MLRVAADGVEPRAPGEDRLAPVLGSDERAKSSLRLWLPGRATDRPNGRPTRRMLARGSSSIDFQNIAAERLACSGRPLSSDFMTLTPSSTAISIPRFQ